MGGIADLNQQAQQRTEILITQMLPTEDVTEKMKAADPLSWVQHMNNIRARAEEIVREELIYT